MRKWIALVIAVVMLACASTAAAEEIDLTSLSDDEIVALLAQIQEEIVARHIEATATLASGIYIAGKDIPAGAYVFTCMATGDDWGNVTIYSEKGDGDLVFWEIASAPEEGAEPESFFITLNENDQLKSDVPFSLTIYAGALFK